MDTSFILQHLKTRRVFLLLCILSVLAYVALVMFLLQTLVFDGEQVDSLRVDTVAVYEKTDGRGMLVELRGAGFDENIGAYLTYDAGNQGAIVASLPTWDHLQQVAIAGNKAYLANRQRGFQVVDISDFRKPSIIGSIDTPGPASAVTVSGSYAYVAADGGGLLVIAIDDPQRPRIVANVPLMGRAVDIVHFGHRAFIATRKNGVKIVSIAQPEQPRLVGEIRDGGRIEGLAASETSLFVAKGRQGVWEYALDSGGGFSLLRKLRTGDAAKSVTVHGKELFVCCGSSGVEVFSLHQKSLKPVVSIDTPGTAMRVAAEGDRIYVADNFDGLQIIERHPENGWRFLATVDTPGTALGVAVSEHRAYVADGKSGLQIVSIEDIDLSLNLKRLSIPGFVRGLAVDDNRVYVAESAHGVHLLAGEPGGGARIVSSVATPGNAYDIVAKNGQIYVADGIEGLHVLTLLDKQKMHIVHSIELKGAANAVAIEDNIALVTAGKAGLFVLEAGGAVGAKVVGHSDHLGNLRDVAIVGDYGFVAAGKDGLLQFSIEDPTVPRLIGTVDLPLHLQAFAQTLSVAVSGNRMMVANARAGCQIYDITDPGKPVFLESVAAMQYVYEVKAFAGKGYYLCTLNKGIQEIDLASFEQRRPFGITRLSALAVSGDRMFLGHGKGGISVVPLPMELSEITRHSSQELSIYVPTPVTPGRYAICLTRGEQSLVLPESLNFKGSKEHPLVTNPPTH